MKEWHPQWTALIDLGDRELELMRLKLSPQTLKLCQLQGSHKSFLGKRWVEGVVWRLGCGRQSPKILYASYDQLVLVILQLSVFSGSVQYSPVSRMNEWINFYCHCTQYSKITVQNSPSKRETNTTIIGDQVPGSSSHKELLPLIKKKSQHQDSCGLKKELILCP